MNTPSEHFGVPVLGEIRAQMELITEDGAIEVYGPHEYEFIEAIERDGKPLCYQCNSWYKPGVPQLVPADAVIEVI